MNIREDEVVDDLEIQGYKMLQKKEGFKFGMDSVLLSDFAKDIKKDSMCVDLGTGTGIISFLLCAKTKLKKIYGIEIQEEIAQMANRSIKLNKLEDRFEILNINIKKIKNKKSKIKNENNKKINELNNKKEIKKYKLKRNKKIKKQINYRNKLIKNSFDVIVSNPPYKKLNTGKINENKIKLISRHEITAGFEDFCETSNYLLKDKGIIYLVHRPERISDILINLKKYKLTPKIIKFVYPKINKSPNMVLIKAVKNANDFLQIEKPLIVYDENSNYTNEILKIYNKDKL